MTERVLAAAKRDDDQPEAALRPQTLGEFIGQEKVRANLKVFIDAAASRQEALDHVLFAGPPGLGKTTLAQIVARELGVNFRATSGPVIAKAGDLAALLTNLEERDVLFIDEIHRLSPAVEEILYHAMEDFQLDLIIGEGPAARSVRIDLPKFTLVAATTRTGLLTTPLRERFGIPIRLNFYEVAELQEIVRRGARLLGLPLTDEGALEIARRARGTPRVASRLLRRVRDFAAVAGDEAVDAKLADGALSQLEVDVRGLDALDHRYLRLIAMNYGGGPVGIETIAAGLSEPPRCHRGNHRALSVAAGLHCAHAAWPCAHRACLRTSRADRARQPCAVSAVQRRRQQQRRRRVSNWPDLAGRIEGDTHVLPVRVYFEDTDFTGLVYHANFLKFCERGRSDFIRLLGIDHRSLENPKAGEPAVFVVRRIEVDYLKPARIDEVLEVVTRCADIGGATLKLVQEVRREGAVLVRLAVSVVLVSRTGKPQRLGQLVRGALQRFVSGGT